MKAYIYSGALFLCSISTVFAAAKGDREQPVNTVSYEHVLNWSLGLVIVLCLFFASIWFMRKMGALPANSGQNLRVVGGLSLGMREKLVLVQVGEKQLVLGVTPGRIDNLLVLEGSEQLYQDKEDAQAGSEFSKLLKPLIKGNHVK